MNQELQYYGVIDSVEIVNSEQKNWYYVLVDCIEAKGLDKMFLNQNSDIKLIDIINELSLELLLVKIPFEINDSSFQLNKFTEGRWLKVFSSNQNSEIRTVKLSSFTVGTDNNPTFDDGSLFNFLGDNTEGFSYSFEPIDGRISLSRKLRDGNNLELAAVDFVNESKAKSMLSEISLSKEGERFATCYNVGQGNAVCISERLGEEAKPLMYFDIGGGANFNTFTYPVSDTRNFKVAKNTLFILSHWDEDHYETARRDINLVKGRTYIAPAQIVTPRNLKFVKHIIDNGELILLPATFKNHDFDLGTLVRCSVRDLKKKNDSGLALMLDLKKENNLSTILLPGDAQYKFIPDIDELKFDAIMATHHGGKLYRPFVIPTAIKKSGCVAYSYGDNNIYHHPLHTSVNSHERNSWGINIHACITRLDTVNGDISFSWLRVDNTHCINSKKVDEMHTFEDTSLQRHFVINQILNE